MEKLSRGARISEKTVAWVFAILFFAVFSYSIPRLVDDWAFLNWFREAKATGVLATMRRIYEKLNGRILGNGLLLALTGSKLARTLYKTILFSAVFFCMGRLSGLDRKPRWGMAVVFLTMMLVPFTMRRETYAWDAALINYLSPMALLLCYLVLLEPLFSGKPVRDTGLKAALCFPAGVCAGLFVENVALCALALSAAAVVWHRVACKRFSVGTLCFFAGAAIGVALLFSSPALTSGGSAYRGAPTTLASLLGIVKENYQPLSTFSLESYFVPQLLITVSAIGLLSKAEGTTRARRRLKNVLLVLLPALSVCFYLMSRGVDWVDYGTPAFGVLRNMLGIYPAIALDALLYALYVAGVAGVFLFFTERRSRSLGLCCIALALVLAAPMLFVQPVGPRCFLGCYLFWSVAALLLTGEAARKIALPESAEKGLAAAATSAMLAAGLCTAGLYGTCPKIERARTAYIEQQMRLHAPIIVLPAFDCDTILLDVPVGMSDYYYYEEPGDIQTPFIPYSEWVETFSGGVTEE